MSFGVFVYSYAFKGFLWVFVVALGIFFGKLALQ